MNIITAFLLLAAFMVAVAGLGLWAMEKILRKDR
jgi:hypothetical protein